MNIIFPLSLLAASFMAQAAQTPPGYDPDSLVCPGKCIGNYTNMEFGSNCLTPVVEYLKTKTRSFEYTLGVLGKLEKQARADSERMRGWSELLMRRWRDSGIVQGL
ncbi:hypothetical protein C8J57DRAFT_1468917 [Mycena rebaudengoi]|nr:hypothetical protein C8J57DRAFT_1468917 [Mycena rebaudengoi]